MREVKQREAGVALIEGVEVSSDALLDALKTMGLDDLDLDSIADEFREPIIRLKSSWTGAISASTLASRRSDLRRFSKWCAVQGEAPFSSDEALAFLMGRHLRFVGQSFAPGTAKRIGSNLTALAKGVGSGIAVNKAQGSKVQATRAAQKLERAHGVQRKKTYLTVPEIQEIRKAIAVMTSSSLLAVRDLAIFDISCDLLASRIEIVRMQLRDFEISKNTVRFCNSRANQIDCGTVFEISSRTAASVEAWLDVSGISDLDFEGAGALPMFAGIMNGDEIRLGPDGVPEPMAGRTVSRAIQRYAVHLRIPGVTGHSLRRSMAHALYEAKVPEEEIVRKGRWSSLDQMREYVGLTAPIDGASDLIFLK